ncbi:MAG: hypothetical protein GY869_31485, partial [Planctomycetes bacterium]|nr:hypothetical protein [Planctomycetota bacterium]
FYKLKEYNEAISEYKKARDFDNGNPSDISVGESRCCLALGKDQTAFEYAERATIENPESEEAKNFLKEVKEKIVGE